jgi:hypothetical protein
MNGFDDGKFLYDKMKEEEEIKRRVWKMVYNEGREDAIQNRYPKFPNDDAYMAGYLSINPRGKPYIPDDKEF